MANTMFKPGIVGEPVVVGRSSLLTSAGFKMMQVEGPAAQEKDRMEIRSPTKFHNSPVPPLGNQPPHP